jgi:hypothetical protein
MNFGRLKWADDDVPPDELRRISTDTDRPHLRRARRSPPMASISISG